MKIYCAILVLLILSFPIFSQVKDEIDPAVRVIPYSEINVAFALDVTGTLQDVGFDNAKSSWKLSYELRFLSDSSGDYNRYRKFYSKSENQGDKLEATAKANKELDKQQKKASIRVTKGKIKKTSLESEDNRVVILPVKLTPQIQQIIADSAASKKNPEFIVSVKGRVSTKTGSNLKFNQKYLARFECPVKINFVKSGKSYWLLNRCGALIEIVKDTDKIRFGMTSRL